jgi:hypothetical protein
MPPPRPPGCPVSFSPAKVPGGGPPKISPPRRVCRPTPPEPAGAAVTASLLERNHRAWAKLRTAYGRTLPCPCWRCGRMISPGEPWHLGHVVDRALGGTDERLAPEHAGCSRRSGSALGVTIARMRLRGVVTGPTSRQPPPGTRARAARAARLAPSRSWLPGRSRRRRAGGPRTCRPRRGGRG